MLVTTAIVTAVGVAKMKKIIIGDYTYDIPDKVQFLIDDLIKKNDRLRKKVKYVYREGWEDGARLGTWEGEK